jgi:hypothetical protein
VASETSSEAGTPAATPTPRHDDECPHVVEIRGFDLSLTERTACELAKNAPGCFRAYCQPSAVDCAAACSDPTVNACQLPTSFLAAFKTPPDGGLVCTDTPSTIGLHCAVTEIQGTKQSGCPVEGRRPPGLVTHRATTALLGDYFAECTWLEAASVVAFRELALALHDLGAGSQLTDACLAAAEDEERHAAVVGALARRFDGRLRDVEVRRPPSRRAFDLALDNMVEGVVRETFGAAVALWRAEHAADAEVKSVMREIAEDECRHAELALRIAYFLDDKLEPDERATIDQARISAIEALYAASVDDPSSTVMSVAGVPSASSARALLDGLVGLVWGTDHEGERAVMLAQITEPSGPWAARLDPACPLPRPSCPSRRARGCGSAPSSGPGCRRTPESSPCRSAGRAPRP